MVVREIGLKLSSKLRQISHLVSRGCIRGLSVVAIIAVYGLGQIGLPVISGLALTASTKPAEARWGWGRRGWGGWGRGWGRRGWYAAPKASVRAKRPVHRPVFRKH